MWREKVCVYVWRDGGVEGKAMCYSVCGKLGVGIEGEMEFVEETHVYTETATGVLSDGGVWRER